MLTGGEPQFQQQLNYTIKKMHEDYTQKPVVHTDLTMNIYICIAITRTLPPFEELLIR
jgi:organic radical activating enzyme